MQDPENFQSGQKVGGGCFELRSKLGRGGMGIVWRAYDNSLGEEVALKFLLGKFHLDPEAVTDMRREVRESRRLTHSNIIRIHNLAEPPGEQPFICMEYVEGSSLHVLRKLRPQRLYTWADLRPMVQQLCAALSYAHEQNVIHRDLKPGNLMLDIRQRLKLADFGLAAVISEVMNRQDGNANSAGTPAYMSPQQMKGEHPEVTDDIYSFGATLYELLTSKPPIYGDDISRRVRTEKPERVEERLRLQGCANEIPEHVGHTILACLAKDPGARPQSVAEIVDLMDVGEVASEGGGRRTSRKIREGALEEASRNTRPPTRLPHTAVRPWVGWGIGGGGVALALLLLAIVHFWEKSAAPKPSGEQAASTPRRGIEPSDLGPTETTKTPVLDLVIPTDPPPPDSDIVKIFDENEIGAWEPSGPTGFWTTNQLDHAIQADLSKAPVERSTQTFTWKREHSRVKDFELTFEARVISPTSQISLVQFGVRYRVDRERGYCCRVFDATGFPGQLSRLYGSVLSLPDKDVTIQADEEKLLEPAERKPETVRRAFRAAMWSRIKIEASSGDLSHSINDEVCAVVKDQNLKLRSLSGTLELYVVSDGTRNVQVEFRELFLHPK